MRWIELDFEDEQVVLPRGAHMLLGLDGSPVRNRMTPLFEPGSLDKLSDPCTAGHVGKGFLSHTIETVHRDAHRYRIWLLWRSIDPKIIGPLNPPFRVMSNDGFLGVAVVRLDQTLSSKRNLSGPADLPELALLCSRKGYGTFLLKEVKRFVRESWGANRIRVNSVRETEGFYKKNGFRWLRELGRGIYVPMLGLTV